MKMTWPCPLPKNVKASSAGQPRKSLMSYGVECNKRAETELYSWNLPLAVYVEIERRLATELSEEPTRFLRNIGKAMQYTCRIIEQGSAPIVHIFLFRVRYSRDEQALIIWDCC